MTRSRDVSAVQNNLGVAIPPAAAGKNVLINGGFDIWQRGTSFTGGGIYTADRWIVNGSGGTYSTSRSTDAPSTFNYSLSLTGTTATYPQIIQRIEGQNAQNLAGNTVTLSFWAKSATTTGIGLATSYANALDNWSASTVDINNTIIANPLTNSWVKYSYSFTMNANAKNGYQILIYRDTTSATSTTYITGIQLELGSSATPFSRAGGNIQGELAACQRYYFRYASSQYLGVGHLQSTTAADFYIKTPVTMRTAPTYAAASGTNYFQVGSAGATTSYSTIGNFYGSGTDGVLGRITVSGFTAGQGCAIVMASASAWVEGSAEL